MKEKRRAKFENTRDNDGVRDATGACAARGQGAGGAGSKRPSSGVGSFAPTLRASIAVSLALVYLRMAASRSLAGCVVRVGVQAVRR